MFALLLLFFLFLFFFFNDTATTEIYTFSLHDALPIFTGGELTGRITGKVLPGGADYQNLTPPATIDARYLDRKSTRLNSSHGYISYAVFCLKKKKKTTKNMNTRTTLYNTVAEQSTI